MEVTVWIVFIAASITAIFTGLGALPFLFMHNIGDRLLGTANAVAAGLMLGASIGLIYEGTGYDIIRLAIGVIVGLLLIIVSRRLIGEHHEELHIGNVEGVDAMKMLMIVGIMTIHSFAEGIGIGVAYGDGETFGSFISIAIAIHNIPEGLAISLVLIPRGTPVWRAAWWSIFSSIPQPLMAVPAFLFVTTFQAFLPVGLGLAAGAMIWMVFYELMPEALETVSRPRVYISMGIAMVSMLAFQALIG